MGLQPLLSDTQPSKYVYKAGDRILSRVSCPLNKDQMLKLERAIKTYTRSDVRILILDCTQIRLLWKHKSSQEIETLVSTEDIILKGIDAGVVNLDCSVTELMSGDTLTVLTPIWNSQERQRIKEYIQRWAGQDVEVIVLEGK